MNPSAAKLPEFEKVRLTSVEDVQYTQVNHGIGCLSGVIVYQAGTDPGLLVVRGEGELQFVMELHVYIDIHLYLLILRSHEAFLAMGRLISGW